MLVNPYGRDPVRLLCDLANDPPESPTALGERCRAAGMVFDGDCDDDDLRRVTAFITDWCSVVDAMDDRTRVERLNRLLGRWTSHPRVTDHAGGGWHLHYRPDGMAPGGIVCAIGAMGTALHVTERGMHRLGRCEVEGCTQVFADVSRPGRQRFCSHACANRDAVRRHRRRSRGTAGLGGSTTA